MSQKKSRSSASKPTKKKSSKPSAESRRKVCGWWLTAVLAFVLVAMICTLWALFISGPARIHEERIAQVERTITEAVPDIQGLQQTEFDYVTWQGYTSDQLYWFDATGSLITTRELSSLDYNGARQKAIDSYGMEPDTVSLAYGYSGPVYQLESSDRLLMLDYDTLDWVYERNVNNAREQ